MSDQESREEEEDQVQEHQQNHSHQKFINKDFNRLHSPACGKFEKGQRTDKSQNVGELEDGEQDQEQNKAKTSLGLSYKKNISDKTSPLKSIQVNYQQKLDNNKLQVQTVSYLRGSNIVFSLDSQLNYNCRLKYKDKGKDSLKTAQLSCKGVSVSRFKPAGEFLYASQQQCFYIKFGIHALSLAAKSQVQYGEWTPGYGVNIDFKNHCSRLFGWIHYGKLCGLSVELNQLKKFSLAGLVKYKLLAVQAASTLDFKRGRLYTDNKIGICLDYRGIIAKAITYNLKEFRSSINFKIKQYKLQAQAQYKKNQLLYKLKAARKLKGINLQLQYSSRHLIKVKVEAKEKDWQCRLGLQLDSKKNAFDSLLRVSAQMKLFD